MRDKILDAADRIVKCCCADDVTGIFKTITVKILSELVEELKPSHDSAMNAILQLESKYRYCKDTGALVYAIESAVQAAKQHQ